MRGWGLMVVLAALGCAGRVCAQLPEAVRQFDAALQHYAAGDFTAAVEGYEAALERGYASGALFYNMGNAYYRMDQYGQAIRYWEKSRRLLGEEPALLHNMAIVRSRVGTPFSSVPSPFWRAWWEQGVVSIGIWPLFVAGLLLYFMAAVLFGARIWTRVRGPWLRRARVFGLGTGLVLLLAAFGVSASMTRVTTGVVIVPETSLADSAGAAGTIEVPEGVVVKLLGEERTWRRIRLPNGVEGYVPSASVGEI